MRLATENDSPSTTNNSLELMDVIASHMKTIRADYKNAGAYGCGPMRVQDGESMEHSVGNGTMYCNFVTSDGMQFWLPASTDATLLSAGGTCYKLTGTIDGIIYEPAAFSNRNSCEANSNHQWAPVHPEKLSDAGCSNDNICFIIVDVNGEKGPNKASSVNEDGTVNIQDRFALMLTGANGTKVIPAGPAAAVMYQK